MGTYGSHRLGVAASILAAVAFTAVSPPPAAAQATQEVPEFVEQERRAQMGPAGKLSDEFFWDIGGWLRTDVFFIDDEPFKDQRSFRFYDLRVWGLVEFESRFRIYARTFTQWQEYNNRDGFGDDDVWRRVRPDVFWMEGRFEDVLFPDMNMTLRVGRQFLSVGRGTLFFDNADGVGMEIDSEEIDFKFFGARSIRHNRDIDPTRPDSKESRRMFYGAELGYTGLENTRLYLIGFVNDDKNGDRLAFQDFDYESEYIGAGVKGNPYPGLSYQVEAVFEFGSSIAEFSSRAEDIKAWSATARIQYYPETDWDLLVFFEYLFGSGDSDRASPTGTIGGNDLGSTDHGFVPFGFVQTGYVLFPRLANLHVLRLGTSFQPFLYHDIEEIKNMEFGATFYYYFKHHHQGGISDSRASLPDRDIGQEFDFYMRWRIFSDLGMDFRMGLFLPGDAYPSAGHTNDLRKFISVGMVFSF